MLSEYQIIAPQPFPQEKCFSEGCRRVPASPSSPVQCQCEVCEKSEVLRHVKIRERIIEVIDNKNLKI